MLHFPGNTPNRVQVDALCLANTWSALAHGFAKHVGGSLSLSLEAIGSGIETLGASQHRGTDNRYVSDAPPLQKVTQSTCTTTMVLQVAGYLKSLLWSSSSHGVSKNINCEPCLILCILTLFRFYFSTSLILIAKLGASNMTSSPKALC